MNTKVVPARGWVLIQIESKGRSLFGVSEAYLIAGMVDANYERVRFGAEETPVEQPKIVLVKPRTGFPVGNGMWLVPRDAIVGWLKQTSG